MLGIAFLLFYFAADFITSKWTSKKWPSIVFSVVFLIWLIAPDFNRNLGIHKENLAKVKVRMEGENPFKGLYFDPGAIDVYEAYSKTINNIDQKDRVKTVLYKNMEGIFLTFIEGHIPFHPLWYTGYSWVSDRVYKNFLKEYDHYVLTEHPPIIAMRGQEREVIRDYPGYKDISIPESVVAVLQYKGKK
jgi:hypothetical protein